LRTLKFIVKEQIIEQDPTCNFNGLVPGTDRYVKAEFSFSSDWNGYSKAVEFTSALGRPFPPRKLVDSKSCMIPAEALARRVFKVRVVGKKGEVYIQTNKVEVKQNGGKA
jgi:hypothetical protein